MINFILIIKLSKVMCLLISLCVEEGRSQSANFLTDTDPHLPCQIIPPNYQLLAFFNK